MKMKRLDSLQGLRALAFIGIFMGHCGLMGLSGMGVSIFLVLSGFLMVYNYYSRPEKQCGFIYNIKFSIEKIKRLYPLHLLMILPMLLLNIYGVLKSQNGIWGTIEVVPALIANVLLIQAWFPFRNIYFGFNGVAWYLSVSMFLYFIFPYVLKHMRKEWTRKKAFLVIGFVFFMQILLGMAVETTKETIMSGNTAWFTYIFPLYRSGDFLIGCNLGYLFLTKDCNDNKVNKSTILEIAVILVLVCTYILMQTCNIPLSVRQTVIYMPGVSMLVYVLAEQKGIFSKCLGNKFFVEIGNISAYTFLIHQVVINFVEMFGIKNWLLPSISAIITFLLAYGYRYVVQVRTIVKRK